MTWTLDLNTIEICQFDRFAYIYDLDDVICFHTKLRVFFNLSPRYVSIGCSFKYIQGVVESCTDILTTSYWLHVELGKNI
jgi:hypothetical protein